jgi:hypothetical protein
MERRKKILFDGNAFTTADDKILPWTVTTRKINQTVTVMAEINLP